MTEDIKDLVRAINELRNEVSQLREMMTVLIDLVIHSESEEEAEIEHIPGLMPPEWAPERGFGM